MGKIISVLNFKGGVGKTTTAVNLADALTYRGKNVLVVDTDSQCNTTNILDRDKDVDETIYTALKAIIYQKTNAGLAIFGHSEGLDFVPGDESINNMESLLTEKKDGETILRKLLAGPRNDYDYVIIDCPPTDCLMNINAMVASDYLLIPVDSQPMTLDGFAKIAKVYNNVRSKFNPNLTILGYLLTRYRKNYAICIAVEKFLQQRKEALQLDTVIRENTAISQAAGQRKTIFEYDRNCRGAKDYKALANEVINKTK